jgi:hypothetical protein
MYPLADKFMVKPLSDKFHEIWNDEKLKNRKPLVYTVLKKLFMRRYLPMGFLKLLADIMMAVSPLLIQYILQYIQKRDSNPLWKGLVPVFSLLISTMLTTISISLFFQKVQGVGMCARGVLTSVIFQKAMRLSADAKLKFDSGKITNIISYGFYFLMIALIVYG